MASRRWTMKAMTSGTLVLEVRSLIGDVSGTLAHLAEFEFVRPDDFKEDAADLTPDADLPPDLQDAGTSDDDMTSGDPAEVYAGRWKWMQKREKITSQKTPADAGGLPGRATALVDC